MTGIMLFREDVIKITREWIGTPYHHQASRRGVGADCLGLVRGVYRDAWGSEPERPPPYNPSWAEISTTDNLLTAARRHLTEVPGGRSCFLPGDVLIFKMFARSASKHCGIVSAPNQMIHAYDPHGTVETPLNDDWLRKVQGVFRFPFVRD